MIMLSCFRILFIITFLYIRTVSESDSEVFCVYLDSCILPCSFQSSRDDDVIHWFQGTGRQIHVHSFYNNQDRLGLQDQNFRNRTSLFQDQISRGNCSLLLRGVKVQDQGRYEGFISTIYGIKNSFVLLRVDGRTRTEDIHLFEFSKSSVSHLLTLFFITPISEVHMSQEENNITCSSEGIYPEPGLTWSTIPPSNMELQNRTRVHQTEDQLYSISSSLMVPDEASDLIYSCTVTTQRNQRRATLRRLTADSFSDIKTIHCTDSDISLTDLVWRFNHSQVILNRTRTNITISEEWRKHVKEVSESGSLTLQDLSPEQEGVYSCAVSDEEETKITNIFLRISDENPASVKEINVGSIVASVIVMVVLVVLVVLFVYYRKRKAGGAEPAQEVELNNS